MPRPQNYSDLPADQRQGRIAVVFYSFDALAEYPGVIQAAGQFLDACREAGIEPEPRHGGLEVTVAPPRDQMDLRLKRAQEVWDTGREEYAAAIEVGGAVDPTNTALRAYCKAEGLDVPPELVMPMPEPTPGA